MAAVKPSAVVLAALLALTALAYRPVLTAGFVYEDINPRTALDPQNPIHNRGVWEGWAQERPSLAPRALSNLTMRMQGWAHADAWGFHAGNLALHLLNGALLWLLLARFGVWPAPIGALLFLLHPINHEAVAYVSARPDLIYATGILVMLLGSESDSPWAPAWATCGAVVAMLGKESGVAALALLPLWLLVRGRWSTPWLLTLAVWAVVAGILLYPLVHVSATGVAHPWTAIAGYTAPAAHGALGFAAVQAGALWRLLALLVWPDGFSIDHDFDVMPTWLGAIGLAIFLRLIFWAVRAWRVWTPPWPSFIVLWMVAALAIRFVLPRAEYLHEQHLYVPLLGLWIGLAAMVPGAAARLGIWFSTDAD